MNPLAKKLLERKPGLDALDATWALIDDVVEGEVKYRAESGWMSAYLPKGALEPESEYQRRIEITPFFPQTPAALANRLGTLFKDGVTVQNAAPLTAFIPDAGRRHASLADLAAAAATMVQMHGFTAALIDRDPLPADVTEEISQAEADARQYGRTFIALYAAPAIYDWDYGTDGHLLYVKFAERVQCRRTWDGPLEEEIQVRVVTRETIQLFHITKAANGDEEVIADAPTVHGIDGVPVAFCHPFPDKEGIGRPILRRIAESDVSATRVLSDIVWTLFVLGNPLLTFTTTKTAAQLAQIASSATRYIPLDGGQPNTKNPEELAFVQLDDTGLEMQFKAHQLMMRQGLESTDGQGPEVSGSAAIPREQSGVAQAWRFKTGEERILFLLARSIEKFFSEALRLASLSLGTPCDPQVQLPKTFDENIPTRDPRDNL